MADWPIEIHTLDCLPEVCTLQKILSSWINSVIYTNCISLQPSPLNILDQRGIEILERLINDWKKIKITQEDCKAAEMYCEKRQASLLYSYTKQVSWYHCEPQVCGMKMVVFLKLSL